MTNSLFEQSVGEKLKSMENRLSDLEDKMTSIDTKLTQVVDAILGNPLTRTGGFIDDIEILKQKIVDLEKKDIKHDEFRKRFMWTIGIIVTIAVIVQFIVNMYLSLRT